MPQQRTPVRKPHCSSFGYNLPHLETVTRKCLGKCRDGGSMSDVSVQCRQCLVLTELPQRGDKYFVELCHVPLQVGRQCESRRGLGNPLTFCKGSFHVREIVDAQIR